LAAGLLKGFGRQHVPHLLEYFGAIPIDERVVIDVREVQQVSLPELTLYELLRSCTASTWFRRFNCNMRLNPV